VYDDRVTGLARWIRSGLAVLLAAGCASTNVAGDLPHEPSIDAQLAQAAAFRASNHRDAALATLDRALKRVGQQGGPQALAPATRAALDTELRGADETVRAAVNVPLAAGHPLAAEATLARLAPLLAEAPLAPPRQANADAIKQTGQQVCARLQGTVTAETPYWGLGVSRYCAHFGAVFAPPPRPAALGAFEVTGTLAGLDAHQAALLRDNVTDWLRASLWFDPDGKAVGRGTVEGKYSASFRRQTTTLHAPYKQRIPVYNTSIVPPPPTPVASSGIVVPPRQPEPQSSFGVAVVDQTYAYDVEEVRGDYAIGASVKLDVGAAAPVTLEIRRAQGVKGYTHDVTFEPANITPVHDEVPSGQQWFQMQVASMWGKAVWALNRKFIAAHCKRESYGPDDAVRCAAAGQQAPGVMAALAEAIGEDAGPLVPILQPPPPPPKPEAPPRRPARAAPARKASSGAVDDEDPVIE
jgi:hypothetical protein